MLTSELIGSFIAPIAESIPHTYRIRIQYDKIMDLYININQPGNEDRLTKELDKYDQERST